ncbi:MAG: response regulator transcription factor [Candidatus Marsarchaeota archaeon]|nr:response regulator transcription factor [Candidatus Marsarchaeota archaeon]
MLRTEPSIEIVSEAESGEQAIRLAAELRPDVILMDLKMPGVDGIEATRKVLQVVPEAKVLILTVYEDDEYVEQALEAGASGYVLKKVLDDDLVQAIHRTYRGESVVDSMLLNKMVHRLRRVSTADSASETSEDLTARERQILAQLAAGNSNKEIARKLQITEHTVKSHVKHIFQKLEVVGRVQAAGIAFREGLITNGEAGPSK